MADFKRVQEEYLKVLDLKEKERKSVFQAGEQIKKLRREKERLTRSGLNEKRLFQIQEEEQKLQNEIRKRNQSLEEVLKREGDVLKQYGEISDPRTAIGQWKDQTPILLFPVRLETRFKKIEEGDRTFHQLWVRIFPDDCSIDAFEDSLSESEIKSAKLYWTSVFGAGQGANREVESYVREQRLGAWKGLVGASPAGRAYWIIQHYKPKNTENLPKREGKEDVILVIPAEQLPKEEIQKQLVSYWTYAFQAGADAATQDRILEQFQAAVGSESKAQKLLDTYRPFQFEELLPGEKWKGKIQVVFVHFPESGKMTVRQQSWSNAPRVNTFPDRFVLMGFQNGKEVISQIGAPIPNPLIVGPEPLDDLDELLKEAYQKGEIGQGKKDYKDLADEEKAVLYVEYLTSQTETRWLFDFEAALRIGLGFKVNLKPDQYEKGFDRLMVLGIRMVSDAQRSKEELEKLFHHHHHSSTGFGILPQGTPTNNTEHSASGFSDEDDVEETFNRYFPEEEPLDPKERNLKVDGRWLAESLGIDPAASSLNKAEHYFHTDQRESMAMNTALWPATLGYYMESLLTPVFSDWERQITRWFFNHHLVPRGRMPAIRIGDQPYGILATSAVSKHQWLQRDRVVFQGYSDIQPVLKDIFRVVSLVRQDWEVFEQEVAQVGKTGDAHQILLDVLGLHASSQEFYQRYSQGFNHLYNYLLFVDPAFAGISYGASILGLLPARELLSKLGYTPGSDPDDQPPLFDKSFFYQANALKGPLVDDRPLSETDPVRAYTDEGWNYLEWLIENARTDHDVIKNQKGFLDNRAPTAKLYLMLRHALNLSFLDTSFQLHLYANALNSSSLQSARIDQDFIGFQSNANVVTSKWEYLARTDQAVTGNNLTVGSHISKELKKVNLSPWLRSTGQIIEALELLKDIPTARLERTFVEHLDSCTYRLDAWLSAFVHMQLYGMRFGGDYGKEGPLQSGIYLGAYGWVEDLKPDDRKLKVKKLPEKLDKIFNEKGDSPLLTDNTNAGYIHAPSLNHAVTAAVLRNAYISNASNGNPEAFKVNLSSERVRMALQIIEGMQQGQSLGALLGYQLERGLHDRYQMAEVDFYIYELRKAFPLVANKLNTTRTDPADNTAIDQLEARNVIDGLALIRHIQETGQSSYPFGKTLQATDTAAQQEAIDQEVGRIQNINDAVADLAISESVHQVVQGN